MGMPKLKSDRRFAINFNDVEKPHLCLPEGELFLTIFTLDDPVLTFWCGVSVQESSLHLIVTVMASYVLIFAQVNMSLRKMITAIYLFWTPVFSRWLQKLFVSIYYKLLGHWPSQITTTKTNTSSGYPYDTRKSGDDIDVAAVDCLLTETSIFFAR